MNTLGWVFILAALLLLRAVTKGRVMEIGEDLSDGFLAFARGDSEALKEVLGRSGDSSEPTYAGLDESVGSLVSVGGGIADVQAHVGQAVGKSMAELADEFNDLAFAAIVLGEKAKGYRWEGTGPTYYDCSGLIWRACRALGYTGSRFTTASIRSNKKAFRIISAPGMQGPGVNAAQINDIVLWPAGSGGVTGHMGVITGPDQFYSARSVRSGIGNAKISTFRRTKPIYLRYIGPKQSRDPFS